MFKNSLLWWACRQNSVQREVDVNRTAVLRILIVVLHGTGNVESAAGGHIRAREYNGVCCVFKLNSSGRQTE